MCKRVFTCVLLVSLFFCLSTFLSSLWALESEGDASGNFGDLCPPGTKYYSPADNYVAIGKTGEPIVGVYCGRCGDGIYIMGETDPDFYEECDFGDGTGKPRSNDVKGNGVDAGGNYIVRQDGDEYYFCTDYCRRQKLFCGDGITTEVPLEEQCDDGNDISTDSCVDCKDAECGDGHIYEGQEECDDGNENNDDNCVNCKDSRCGDGYKNIATEECDDGNEDQTDECRHCKEPYCGDGIKDVDRGEECDDDNEIDDDACTNSCHHGAAKISIKKYVYRVSDNKSEDADTAPGPEYRAGDEIYFYYRVKNTGLVPLTNVLVTDNRLGKITNRIAMLFGNRNDEILDPNEMWIYKSELRTAGEYSESEAYKNIGSVTANGPDNKPVIEDDDDSDPAHYHTTYCGDGVKQEEFEACDFNIKDPSHPDYEISCNDECAISAGKVKIEKFVENITRGSGSIRLNQEANCDEVSTSITHTFAYIGEFVKFIVKVTNVGASPIAESELTVSDSLYGLTRVGNPGNVLNPGQTWEYETGDIEVVNSAHTNVATLEFNRTGTSTSVVKDSVNYCPGYCGDGMLQQEHEKCDPAITDSAAAGYHPACTSSCTIGDPELAIRKYAVNLTKGEDEVGKLLSEDVDCNSRSESEAFTYLYAGNEVRYRVEVENTGSYAVLGSEVAVSDSDFSLVFDTSSDEGSDNILSPGEIWIYTADSTVPSEEHLNTASVAFTRGGSSRTLTDIVNYCPGYCGDGVEDTEQGEECDDGNEVSGDDCTNECKNSTCVFQVEYSGREYGEKVLQGEGSFASCFSDDDRNIKAINASSCSNYTYCKDDDLAVRIAEMIAGMDAPCWSGVRSWCHKAETRTLGKFIAENVQGKYIDQDCSVIPADEVQNYKTCGELNFGYRGSPISLHWNADSNIDRQWAVVQFPLDPRTDRRGNWYTWKASKDTPLLVYDPNHVGEIESAYQLFGNWTFGDRNLNHVKTVSMTQQDSQEPIWQDGFEALKLLDSNGDGLISGQELEPLALWFDNNQDGVSDKGEVIKATNAGLLEISTEADWTDKYTGDIYSQNGFKRTTDSGEIVDGQAVDWYGTPYANQHLALLSLSKGKRVNNGSFSKKDFEDTPRDNAEAYKLKGKVNGAWRWQITSATEGKVPEQVPGILGIISGIDKNNRIHGYSFVELPLAKNNFEAKAKIMTSLIKGEVFEEYGQVVIDFISVDQENGTETHSIARLSADGQTLIGESSAELKDKARPGTSTIVSYRWEAKRIKEGA